MPVDIVLHSVANFAKCLGKAERANPRSRLYHRQLSYMSILYRTLSQISPNGLEKQQSALPALKRSANPRRWAQPPASLSPSPGFNRQYTHRHLKQKQWRSPLVQGCWIPGGEGVELACRCQSGQPAVGGLANSASLYR